MSNAVKLLLVAAAVALFQNRESLQLWLNPPELRQGLGPVRLYSTHWCGYCEKTRVLFRQLGVPYTEHDIERSAAARAEHQALGGGGVPVVTIGDRVIRGYDREALLEQLTR